METTTAPVDDPIVVSEQQRFVLRGVDWETYRQIRDALTGRHVRLTYDRGSLEFMTISRAHALISRLIFQFIVVLTQELGLPRSSCGDMTCDREDLDRGLEPDEGFYFENAHLIREKDKIDLTVDPPPDLTVEVDLRRSPKSRMGIYAALGVPEVWRFDGETLRIHQRGADGQYVVVEHSPHFSFVTGSDIVRFVQQRTQLDEDALIQLFREWVREQIRAKGESQP
jgi:Uma2 family endonuclease